MRPYDVTNHELRRTTEDEDGENGYLEMHIELPRPAPYHAVMSVAEIKQAIEQLPLKDRLKLINWLSLELSDREADKLNAWADRERAAGHNRVFESPSVYGAHRKSRRAKSKTA